MSLNSRAPRQADAPTAGVARIPGHRLSWASSACRARLTLLSPSLRCSPALPLPLGRATSLPPLSIGRPLSGTPATAQEAQLAHHVMGGPNPTFWPRGHELCSVSSPAWHLLGLPSPTAAQPQCVFPPLPPGRFERCFRRSRADSGRGWSHLGKVVELTRETSVVWRQKRMEDEVKSALAQ